MKIPYSESGYSGARETSYSAAPGMGRGNETGDGWGGSDVATLVAKGKREDLIIRAVFFSFIVYQMISIFEIIVYETMWFIGVELSILGAVWVVSFIPRPS